MAITSITIENFKCIGDAVTIPIRPITLLFGKNSSGKSTVLQALRYMRRVWEHEGAGGDYINLGGFPSLVHLHELDRKIRIRIEFKLISEESERLNSLLKHGTDPGFAWIEAVTSWNAKIHNACTESYSYGLNGTDWIRRFNPVESLEARPSDTAGSNGTEWHRLNNTTLLNIKHPDIKHPIADDYLNKWSRTALSILEDIISKKLRYIRYLGPIRELPPRNYHPQEMSDKSESLWEEGLEAWNILGRSPQFIKKIINPYMRDVLKLGYSISRQKSISKPHQISVKIHDEKNDIDLDAEDVGSGISQVIPVLVGALHYYTEQYQKRYDDPNWYDGREGKGKFFAVEQPELHLHPAAQVALGDVFIDCINTFVREFDELKEAFDSTEGKDYQDEKKIKRYATIWMNLMKENRDHPHLEKLIKSTGENSFSKVGASILRMLASDKAKYEEFKEKLRLNGRILLIETHSEHLLLRLLRRVHETSSSRVDTKHRLTPDDLSVVYVQPTPTGAKFTPVSVTDDGDFDEPWPEGFFEERDSELFYHA